MSINTQTSPPTIRVARGPNPFILKQTEWVVEEVTLPLTHAEVENFAACLRGAGFWSLPEQEANYEIGFDGFSWFVEAVEDGRIHEIYRWMPDETPARGLAGMFRCEEQLSSLIDKKIKERR